MTNYAPRETANRRAEAASYEAKTIADRFAWIRVRDVLSGIRPGIRVMMHEHRRQETE